MASIPRIITVDPQADVSRLVRAAVALLDRPVVQVDVPGSWEALEEIERGGYSLVVTALHIDKQMQGFELALRIGQASPATEVVILAGVDDLEELDDETRAESPFVYLRRPVDPAHFVQVIQAALLGNDVRTVHLPAAPVAALPVDDFGPVPALDLKAAGRIIDALLTDVGARTIVLSSRGGDVLLERGASGGLDRTQLAQALLPNVRTTVGMSGLLNSAIATLQYFDAEQHDIFVLSVGYHYFLSLIFEGQAGSRQFGAVTRFGRRAAEDLKVLLGAAAHTLQAPLRPTAPPEVAPPPGEAPVDVVEPAAVKAETWEPDVPEPVMPEPEPEAPLEPIADLDLSILDGLADLDSQAVDDLFDPDRLAEIASETRNGRGPLTYEEARDLGIVP